MTDLVLLTQQQMADYIASLNLTEGGEAYRTLNLLLLLPQQTFAKAISALAQGLITFADVKTLPAINQTLVMQLITSRLSDTGPTSLYYSYSAYWVPAAIDVPAMTASAVGSPTVYLSARFYDFWGGTVQPVYDFTGTVTDAYHSYAQALAAYLAACNSQEAMDAVAAFQAAHAALRAAYPALLQGTDAACPVLQAVLSLLTTPYFLRSPAGARVPNEILDYVASGAFRNVTPGGFKSFMETVAYPAMVANYPSDTQQDGSPGALAAQLSTYWAPLPAAGIQQAFDFQRMAQVWLPAAYGFLVLDQPSQEASYATMEALLAYLEAARTAVLAVKEAVRINFSPNTTGPLTGTPIGLLPALTYS